MSESQKSNVRLMVLNRDHLLISTKGHAIPFKKGTPIYVPPMIQHEAVAIGAQFEDGEPLPVPEERMRSQRPTEPERMREVMFLAFEILLSKNERGDFMASGVPHQTAVGRELGFSVSSKDVSAYWKEYNASKAA